MVNMLPNEDLPAFLMIKKKKQRNSWGGGVVGVLKQRSKIFPTPKKIKLKNWLSFARSKVETNLEKKVLMEKIQLVFLYKQTKNVQP